LPIFAAASAGAEHFQSTGNDMLQRHIRTATFLILTGFSGNLAAKPPASYTVFDPPGSIYTYPTSIAAGVIGGSFEDSSGYTHGFVRARMGRSRRSIRQDR
jgi:hypothetical protein